MLWVLDVGNTNTVIGLFRNEELVENWRISTDREKTVDEYGLLFNSIFSYHDITREDITGLCLSCVVPPLIPALEGMARKYFDIQPLIIGPGVKTGMAIHYENPKEVGADRIVNSLAAFRLYGGPAVVVDFGTATTFDVIDEDGSYCGGAIAPGIAISTEALFERAAKLPRIELIRPPKVIGNTTVRSMQAGIYYGFLGQITGLLRRITDELDSKPIVIATGGLAEMMGNDCPLIDEINPLLTLEGLRIIYALNEKD